MKRPSYFSCPLWRGILLTSLLPVTAAAQGVGTDKEAHALEMSLEELLDVQVTSVSKRPQSLSDAAAAVFVITNEDLRRSGVRNIPDALRMVPGINVARIGSNKWAVTARGFNGRFANKLLVLVDGRTVYSPTFSGVYWEALDLMLEDVERIEVIRGPGATLWGANAVNGVINIITRHAADSQRGLVSAGVGSEERGFAAARYGARLAEGTYGRLYAKAFERDAFAFPGGRGAGDGWQALRGGFRVDSQFSGQDGLTLEGDIHSADIDQQIVLPQLAAPFVRQVADTASVAQGNIMVRWDHTASADSGWTLQAYYDHFARDEVFLDERRDTFDLELTYRVVSDRLHSVVWGSGYRLTRDEFDPTPIVDVVPDSRTDQLFSAFVQDQIELVDDRLWLTLGSKFEHNDYTGFELQPSARLGWTLDARNKLWASISRAVRTPSRGDHKHSAAGHVRERCRRRDLRH
jgi:iron complex outermembrane receptor protein